MTREWVLLSLVLLAGLAFLLAFVELRKYATKRRLTELSWGVGLLLVGVTIGEECLVYGGSVTSLLLQSYFFLVAVLVGVLSIGSAELSLPIRWKRVYFAYLFGVSVATGYFAFAYPIGADVVTQGVITGLPGLGLNTASALLTFPAAVLMAAASVVGAFRRRQWSLLYIAAGIVVISAAGGLYLVSEPYTLYYAEFVGVLLLFLGFFRLGAPAPERFPARTVQPPA